MDAAAAPRTPQAWFELLYHELRRRARGELFRHQALTLGATTLLHEAWLRIGDRPLEFASQGELVSYASQAMRGIVIDHIRSRGAAKHGGQLERVTYESQADLRLADDNEVLRVGEVLQDLAQTDAQLAELVDLRFFAGLTVAEIAALRGVSTRTVLRDWEKARMLLRVALQG